MKHRSRVMIMTAALLIGLALWLPALRSRRVAAQSTGLTGSYGFTAAAAYTGATSSTPLALVGVMNFDGAGNVTGSETVVQPDSSPNATTVQSAMLSFTGAYTLNADGTGGLNLTVQVPNTGPVAASIAFVLTDGGSNLMFVQTGGGNSLLRGTGRKQ